MIEQVRDLLRESGYRKKFLQMLYLEIKDFDKVTQINIINELGGKLHGVYC